MKPKSELTELFTDDEWRAMELLVDAMHSFSKVVEDGSQREHDMREIIFHIHALQRMVMSQAAGRLYPDQFRILGGSIYNRNGES